MTKRLVLASASPRRSELLSTAGYKFEICPSSAEEFSSGMTAEELVVANALAKARDIYAKYPSDVVVGADTVVCLGGKILGKPDGASGAKEMLSSLSGSSHSVLTGYAVISKDGEDSGFCTTNVKFRDMSQAEIDSYIASEEPFGKAGAYAIQERGGVFVESVKGDFFNVIGLPVADIYPILKNHGIIPEWQK